jgi:hypothetical protein
MLDFCIHDNRKFAKCTFYRFKVDVGGTAVSRLYSPNGMVITYMLLGMIKIGQGDILQSSARYPVTGTALQSSDPGRRV